ncbi:hypothetical protein DXU07_32205 [Bradyrhizobium elkanii]
MRKEDEMRATIEDRGGEAAGSPSLEADAAAWRGKRGGRPVAIAGEVLVVRIRRRKRSVSSPVSSADRPPRRAKGPR